MENRINIAELLKDCPKGMELDCTTWENVTFEGVTDNGIYIKRNNKPLFDNIVILNRYGCITTIEDEKCRIFPKGKTTWEGFVPPCRFKDGDIVINASREDSNAFVYAGEDEDYYHSYVGLTIGTAPELHTDKSRAWVLKKSGIRFATEEEKQKLFKAIKEDGYKWNAETKTLEKLVEPKFKVGDRIRHKTTNKEDVYEISKVYDDSYGIVDFTWMIYMKYQDQYELVPNKFDINTFKPFDKVLVRCSTLEKWRSQFFEKYDKDCKYPFICMGYNKCKQCIPYEGNEHLFDTTDDCADYYKTWEE